MTQATAIYGSAERNEPFALGETITNLSDDLEGITYTVFQTVVMGQSGGYSVEFTLHLPEGVELEPKFNHAEDFEVLHDE